MSEFISALNEVVWSNALVYLCLGSGLYFTIRSRVLQVRLIPDMFRLLFNGSKTADGVSSFQALSISLGGRVGTGNIAGVATAIAFGGPGALFWMWVMAFLGASTSFVECTLGQIYKERDKQTGEYRGGPAYYLRNAFKHTKAKPFFGGFAVLFAIITVIATGLLLPGVQSNSMAVSMTEAWSLPGWTVGLGVAIVLAVIIVGGVKRIGSVAAIVVPFMAVAYIIAALVVLALNISAVPDAFGLIFASAFGLDATFGGIVGAAVLWGVRRGIYSNEAGQGTGPHPAAAAEVSHPAKQGIVQAFAIYVDTLLVCTATGLLLIVTGAYRVFEGGSADGAIIGEGGALSSDVAPGAGYPLEAFDTTFPGAGPSFIAITLIFFCATTIIAYYYMAETNLQFIMGRFVNSRLGVVTAGGLATRVLQLAFLVATFIGTVSTAEDAWAAGDLGVGLMAWLNLIGILILQQPAFKALRDYERQKKEGLDPTFDPRPLGIKNATFWELRDPATGKQREDAIGR